MQHAIGQKTLEYLSTYTANGSKTKLSARLAKISAATATGRSVVLKAGRDFAVVFKTGSPL
jgi:hypothetical protein